MLITYITKVLIQLIIIFVAASLINYKLMEDYKLRLMSLEEINKYQDMLVVFVLSGTAISFIFTPIV